ncbi:Ig-like domain-containing protein, partial [Spongiivirga sp. MCCC 1A20706]|uniref:Ig-like domain-containing protein n=1 Tax=Spongiivirga sp. MCCC 1A20706 TaxID=3160963 RepID=UPI003977A7DA
MKRIFFFLLLSLSIGANAQNITFNDANFKAAIIADGVDTNNDGEISQAEAQVTTSLSVANSGITDVSELSFFTSLISLDLQTNAISSVNLSSQMSLEILNMNRTSISSIDVSSLTSLRNLSLLSVNNLTVLDVSSNIALEELIIAASPISAIDLSANLNLEGLSCGFTNVSSLDLSLNTKLKFLVCNNTNLTSLDLSNNTDLDTISCENNSISSLTLPIPSSAALLGNLIVRNNNLTALDVTGYEFLSQLDCSNNSLVQLKINNGPGADMSNGSLVATNNPGLSCIEVSDVTTANSNIFYTIDATASYSTFCNYNINFPDPNMKAAVIAQGVDTNNDGEIQESEALVPTNLTLFSVAPITDATGIEFFTSLTRLSINGNLTFIDVSNNILLEELGIGGSTGLTQLDVSQNTALKRLYIEGNGLTSLDVSALSDLEELGCGSNALTSLDVSNNPQLTLLSCIGQNITSLDLSLNNALVDVECYDNNLTSLILPSSNTTIRQLYCYDNSLASLDISGLAALDDFNCRNNNISVLDFTSNIALQDVECQNNSIGFIDLSNSPGLRYLDCSNNALTYLDIKTGNTAGTNLFLDARMNANLECINVDDAATAATNTRFNKDATASYSENCGPVVTISNAPTTTSDPFAVTFNIDRDVTGFDISDIVLTNATASNFVSVTASEYTALITPTSICAIDITIDVPSNSMLDTTNRPNAAAAQVIVTTVDNVNPTVLGQDITIQLDASGQASIIASDIDNGSTDNCGIASIVASKTSYSCADLGVNEVVLTVTDTNNNISTTTVAVTVEDTINPIAVARNITVQLDTTGQINVAVADIENGSSDNCGIVRLSTFPSVFTCADLGQNNVTLTIEDTSGNTDTATAIVTVEDNQPLTAIAQDITVQLDVNGQATITPQDVDNGSGSGCGNISLSLDTTTFDCSNIGQNTVTLTVTEGPNTETATAIVTVEDTIPPSVIPQVITVQLDSNGQASITPTDVDNGSADNCGIATRTLDITSFDCSNIGANTVTLTVTDNEGNVGSSTTTVTVTETVAPTAIAQDITVQLDASGQASITPQQIDNGSSDNCAVDTLTLDQTSFTCSDLGTNTVTLTVTDTSGNSATATAVVTVEEDPNQPLTAIAQDITVQLDANGSVTITPQDVDNGSNSGCNSNPTLSLDIDTFDCSNLGTNTVTLTATQGSITSTATATVTVEDTLAPTVTTQDITLTLDANNTATITTSDINNGSTDNCTADTDLTYSVD